MKSGEKIIPLGFHVRFDSLPFPPNMLAYTSIGLVFAVMQQRGQVRKYRLVPSLLLHFLPHPIEELAGIKPGFLHTLETGAHWYRCICDPG